MALKKYQQPITDICLLNTRVSVMIGADPDEGTSMQLNNEHHWEMDRLDEGLDDSPYPHSGSSLWEE